MRKLRLLKVTVQATFVADDGETLEEITTEPVVIAPAAWPTYPAEGFAQAMANLEAQLNPPEGNGEPQAELTEQ